MSKADPTSQDQDQLAVRVVSIAAVALIAMQILAQGYLPVDDALRHAGKAVSGKPWDQIILMRPGMVDFSPGWHALLRAIHLLTGANTHTILLVEIILLFALFFVPGLLLMRRPEAWIVAVAVAATLEPQLEMRLLLGRPLVFAMAVLATMCLTWQRLDTERLSPKAFVGATALVALATFVHGSWYLWALPIIACLLAEQWRVGIRLAGATVAGWLIGAVLTGHPIAFLWQNIQLALFAGGDNVTTWVYEMKPYAFVPMLLLAVPILAVIRKLWVPDAPSLRRDPVLILAALGWILGLKSGRFWMEWGTPALVVWMAREIEGLWLAHGVDRRRMLTAGVLAGASFVIWTANVNERWAPRHDRALRTVLEPRYRSALPDSGGIIYSDDRRTFYELLYLRPHAAWRHAVGYAPEIMPADDYAVYRARVYGDIDALEPWARKLRSEDRLFIKFTAGLPPFPYLEWMQIPGGLWVGRAPR